MSVSRQELACLASIAYEVAAEIAALPAAVRSLAFDLVREEMARTLHEDGMDPQSPEGRHLISQQIHWLRQKVRDLADGPRRGPPS